MSVNKFNFEKTILTVIKCNRCGGSGMLPQFKHVERGVCFKCKGEGVVKNFSRNA
jgi:DnaJ-class molecular chaperone